MGENHGFKPHALSGRIENVTLSSQTCCSSYHFDTSYEQHIHAEIKALERKVLGCDYGGTSWTTKSQADAIAGALGLKKGVNMLEIGAGTGWPGIYTAARSGCSVTLLDLPFDALRYATKRASEEGMADSSQAVVASGSALPFAPVSFAAIGHSDVLCCLPDKLDMLRECRRIATGDARMLFFVIAPTGGLSGAKLGEALEAGPAFVGVPDDYASLLEASGWNLQARTDLTEDYLSALQRLVKGLEAGAETLPDVMGAEAYADELLRRRLQTDAIGRGLLEREMFLARAD